MENSLEKDYRDFIQIQDLKGELDIPKLCAEFQISEEELFEFVNERVTRLEAQGFGASNVGELPGTLFLFGYWLRGVRS